MLGLARVGLVDMVWLYMVCVFPLSTICVRHILSVAYLTAFCYAWLGRFDKKPWWLRSLRSDGSYVLRNYWGLDSSNILLITLEWQRTQCM